MLVFEVLRVFLNYFLTWYPRYLSHNQLTVEYTPDRTCLGFSWDIRGLSKKFVEFVDKNKTTGAINL